MKIVIIYASNSGSNYQVSGIVATALKKKHAVTVLRARDTKIEHLTNADLVILGSPSWLYLGQEGMPPEAMSECMARLSSAKFTGKPFAIFGCGESAYTNFCGAVGHLEEFVAQINGYLICPSLKIDGYFFDEIKNSATAKVWAECLLLALKNII